MKWPHVEPDELKKAGSNPAGRAKLYVVVDSGLLPGAKACQAAHALREFAGKYPELEQQWWTLSNTLAILETTHDDLLSLEKTALAKGVAYVRFVEPDWAPDGTLTALVLGPDGKRLVRHLPLAFSHS